MYKTITCIPFKQFGMPVSVTSKHKGAVHIFILLLVILVILVILDLLAIDKLDTLDALDTTLDLEETQIHPQGPTQALGFNPNLSPSRLAICLRNFITPRSGEVTLIVNLRLTSI